MLKLYDSLTRQTMPFVPQDAKTATIYACGPTVYHYAHIGNCRTFAVIDLLRRYLEYKGLKVKLVMNITDVGHMLDDADTGEDKIEKAAEKEGKTPKEIADFYEAAFFRDIDALGIKRAWKYPHATAHVRPMVALVERLLEKGYAYVTEKGDVYFDVAKDGDYGKLSGNTVGKLIAGARVEVKEDKRHPADFALWINNPHHVLQWKGPRGIRGYPGWHLECSAMSMKYLGETFDLHAGGEDLKFPHHECEIAQSECATGKPFARHWLHVSHLLVEGEKMSKSKGNFYTLDDLLKKGYSPEAVRYLLLSAHYRTQLNFTLEGLKAAEKTVEQFRQLAARLKAVKGKKETEGIEAAVAAAGKSFEQGLDDDLDVSHALAILHGFMNLLNRRLDEGNVGAGGARKAIGFLKETLEGVFGIPLEIEQAAVPSDVKDLLDKRAKARAEKRWADADRLRDEIAGLGWHVEDGPDGQKAKKK